MLSSLLFFACLLSVALSLAPGTYVLTTTSEDLREKARGRSCCPMSWAEDDSEQLTQVVYNERLEVHAGAVVANGMVQVECPEQPMLYNGTWQGYVGFVPLASLLPLSPRAAARKLNVAVVVRHALLFRRSCHLNGCVDTDIVQQLSFGTWLAAVGPASFGWLEVVSATGDSAFILESDTAPFISSKNEQAVRAALIARAPLLLGWPYSWGGRSAFDYPRQATRYSGLDCSGLVSILYRSAGIVVPRDASKQAMKVANVTTADMQVGDVFFLGISGRVHVTHVMMLYERGAEPKLVESAGNSTRILPIRNVFGSPLQQLVWGQKITSGMDTGAYLTWGNFFPILNKL